MHANDTPLLPQWADDEAVNRAVDTLFFDIRAHHSVIDAKVANRAPELISETEAYLRHIAEGW